MENADPLVASSVHRTPAQTLQREGRNLPRLGRDHLFQWEGGISLGFSTETTGSQRNPETRRSPSYIPRILYSQENFVCFPCLAAHCVFFCKVTLFSSFNPLAKYIAV